MRYKIKINPKVAKFLKKLDVKTAIRIKEKLKLLQIEPFIYLEHLSGHKVHKLRIGDYRALIDVDKEHKIVYVQIVDHRKRIYKKI